MMKFIAFYILKFHLPSIQYSLGMTKLDVIRHSGQDLGGGERREAETHSEMQGGNEQQGGQVF